VTTKEVDVIELAVTTGILGGGDAVVIDADELTVPVAFVAVIPRRYVVSAVSPEKVTVCK
jgi:hypothetical protein